MSRASRAPGSLRVCALAGQAGASVSANARAVSRAIAQAAARKAQVLLTPECFLTGYPSAGRADFGRMDWGAVAASEAALHGQARRAGLLLVLGSAGPMGSGRGRGVLNLAICCGAVPPAGQLRLAKRMLTPTDAKHFVAGPPGQPDIVRHAGWKLGLSICFEVRFGAIFARQAAQGADAFIAIAHMAGHDPDPGTKARVIPAIYACRAAEWATPLVLCNTSAADRYLPSGSWDARGDCAARRARGVLEVKVQRREALDGWYARLRQRNLAVQRGR